MDPKNYLSLLVGVFTIIIDSLQSYPLFSLQPAIEFFDNQDTKLSLQQDLESNNFDDDPMVYKENEHTQQVAQLAENFLKSIESEKANEENLDYHKRLRKLFAKHQSEDLEKELFDFVQSDDVDQLLQWKRSVTLLPWLPAKRKFSVSKRSLEDAQSKKVSHDLEGIYGKKQHIKRTLFDDESRRKTKEKRETFKSNNRPFTWSNIFGIDKKSMNYFDEACRNALVTMEEPKLEAIPVENIVEYHRDASFRKKAYDLEKMQKTITLLKQSAEFENLLKKYLDSNFAAMKKAKRLAVKKERPEYVPSMSAKF